MGSITRRPAARADVIAIWRYIARDSEYYADAMIDRIDAKLALLADNPLLGSARSELVAGLRSFAVGNYVLFYTAVPGGIEVVRVLHSARDAKELLLRP